MKYDEYALRMLYERSEYAQEAIGRNQGTLKRGPDGDQITIEITFELLVVVDHLTDHVNLLVDVEEEAVLCVLHHIVPHHEAGHVGPGHGLLQVRDH